MGKSTDCYPLWAQQVVEFGGFKIEIVKPLALHEAEEDYVAQRAGRISRSRAAEPTADQPLLFR
jgi:hypothetical protein